MGDARLGKGYWRDASRPLHVYGVPAPLLLLYLFWFRFPGWYTLGVVSAILVFFRVLSAFGWTLSVLSARWFSLLRGRQLAGRPWWYRRFTEWRSIK